MRKGFEKARLVVVNQEIFECMLFVIAALTSGIIYRRDIRCVFRLFALVFRYLCFKISTRSCSRRKSGYSRVDRAINHRVLLDRRPSILRTFIRIYDLISVYTVLTCFVNFFQRYSTLRHSDAHVPMQKESILKRPSSRGLKGKA